MEINFINKPKNKNPLEIETINDKYIITINVKNLSKFSFHYYGGPGNDDKRIESDFTIYRHD